MFKINWTINGNVFINGKFSHSIRVELPSKHAQSWNEENGSGLMLGVLSDESISEIVKNTEAECQRIINEACENLKQLRIKTNEYPYRK